MSTSTTTERIRLVEIDRTVRTFFNDLDLIVTDLGWSPEVWIMGYNQFVNLRFEIGDMVDWYRTQHPIPTDSYLLGQYENDLWNMAKIATTELYPSMNLQLTYGKDDRTEIIQISRFSLNPVRCSLLVRSLNEQRSNDTPSQRASPRY